MYDCYSFCDTDQPEYDPIEFADIDHAPRLINWLIESTISAFLAAYPLYFLIAAIATNGEDDF